MSGLIQTTPISTQVGQNQQIQLETDLRDSLGLAQAAPAANTIQSRLLNLLDRTGDLGATPNPNSVVGRLATLINNIGEAIASPNGNSLIGRLVSLLSSLGSPGDGAASNDTASSSLIGLAKRQAQTLSQIATNTGGGVVSNTATTTNPTVTTTSATVLSAQSTRKGFSVLNPGTTTIFLEYGGTATATTGIPIPGGFLWVEPMAYTGQLSLITQSGSQAVVVRSFS